MDTSTNTNHEDMRARRVRLGLSQETVARLAGCSFASVSQFERGLKPAESSVLPRILAALDAAESEAAE